MFFLTVPDFGAGDDRRPLSRRLKVVGPRDDHGHRTLLPLREEVARRAG